MKLTGFVNLEELDCRDNQLTELDLTECERLIEIHCGSNHLTNLVLPEINQLRKLYCGEGMTIGEGNQLTNLDLSNCSSLSHLDCYNNQLTTLALPKDSSNLKSLNLSNNNFNQDLSFLEKAVNLEKLVLKNNKFYGSLEPLKDLNKLKRLYIENTDLDSGLEHLQDSVQEFKCSNEKKDAKCQAIIEQLAPYNDSYKNWRLDYLEKQNQEKLRKAEERRIITLLVPVEKLKTAQQSIKRFLENWNQEKLDKLKDKQQLKKYQWAISSFQWTGRVASVIGGSLLLVGTQNNDNNYTITGGIIAIVSPFVEVVTSQLEKSLYEDNKRKWEEFTQATDKLWDTYWELDDILKSINEEPIKEGEVKEALRNLKKEIKSFLKEYDADKNNEIDEEEKGIAKKKIAQDLKNKWAEKRKQLRNIEKITKELCKEVINYRKEINEKINQTTEAENKQTQIQIPPKK